jgi:hypothetical protein
MVGAQILAPLPAPPLYDGVVIEEPYRYLSPGPGQAGNPTSFTAEEPLGDSVSPPIAAATSESPPQAQLIVPPGAFAIPPGTTAVRLSITPVTPVTPDAIVGNAYRITATNQAGSAVTQLPGSRPTLIMRAPAGATDVAIVQLVGGSWQELPTQSSGQPDTYYGDVEGPGDFALRGRIAQGGIGLDPRLLALGALAALGSVLVLLVVLRPRRPGTAVGRSQRRSRQPRKGRQRR